MSKETKISKKIWIALITFGLFGQIAWVIENMYFNVFVYKTITYDPNAIATMVAASAATAALTTLIMGALSDKVAKRKIFICVGYLIWGLVIMSFALVSKENTAKFFPGQNVISFTVGIVVFLDCLMTFFGSTANDAAFNAWVTDVTNEGNRGKAEGLLSALPLFATLIVFGLFDPLTQKGQWKLFFILIGSLVILGSLIGIFVIKDNCAKPKKKTSYFKIILYGFRPSVIKKSKQLYLLFIIICIYCIAQQVFMPYILIYIEYYLSITNYAIVLGIMLIVAAIASILLGKLVDKKGKNKFFIPAGLSFTIGTFLVYIAGKFCNTNVTTSTILLCIIGSFMLGGSLLLLVILNASIRDFTPADKRGHYSGIRMIFVVLIPMLIGPFIGSSIIKGNNLTFVDEFGAIQYIPNPEIFLAASLISLLAFIPMAFIMKSMKKSIPNEKLYTKWGKELDVDNVLKEYPRPQLVRNSYLNLNGKWQYAIYNKKSKFKGYQGDIIVPFSPETLLSGVEKTVTPKDKLYYYRTFNIASNFIKDKTIIHFGAVDYKCEVKINDKIVGSHKGGYVPFSLDCTKFIHKGNNSIAIEVTDPSDTSYISRGKQKINSGGIWYTPQSGIWQTVWLESVPNTYIEKIILTPNIDDNTITINPVINGSPKNVIVKILDFGNELLVSKLDANSDNIINLTNPKLWSPESPFLYDIEIVADTDKVTSYFGMRKFNIAKDKDGITRLMLNNKPYFHNGLLDQGYWSDGMLTAPSDEAMIYDIQKMKDLGFNTLRKHIKMEPMRFYYHCDRLGMIVWQDMINGGRNYNNFMIGIFPFLNKNFIDNNTNYKRFGRQDKAGRDEYYSELNTMINTLYNCVSISVWVPFNEGWGQFDSLKVTEHIKQIDNTRIIDHASGWHDQGGGDLNSKHIYFVKIKLPKDNKRAVVLSEFGGYSHQIKKHVFNKQRIFGYRVFKNIEEFKQNYKKLYEEQIIPNINNGLSASIYTQVSDVEDEINGILTYDRAVCKLDEQETKLLNSKVKY